MKLNEFIAEDGRIVPGVNTTVDVKPGETERQAKKFFGGNGKPKHLGVPGATPNQAFNMGMVSENMSHTAKKVRDTERKKNVKPGTEEWFKLWFSLPYLKESADEVYDILDNVECGPFDGGCVLVAQALQQIHGGDIVVLVNDKGIADHAAVKVGNNLIDFDGALPVKQFVKRFEDNEHVNIKGIRPIKQSDLPEAPRDKELVPQLVNALTESTLNEGYKLKLERDDDMYILHIIDTETGKRTEVRGKSGYESGNYDPEDPLHQLLDKIGKASNISELINGEPVGINPKHPDGADAKKATDTAFNENDPGSLAHKINWGGQNKQQPPKKPKPQDAKSSWWQNLRKRVMGEEETLDEKWSQSYKDSIDCNNPKGFSQKAHCAGRKKNEDIEENFADGKVKGKSRPGRVKRSGASCNGSVTELRRKAKKYSGERGKMYHWCANMKAGKKK